MHIPEQEALLRTYQELDRDCASLYYLIHSKKQWETSLFLPALSGQAGFLQHNWQPLKARVDTIPAPSPAFDAVKGHLCDFLDDLKLQIEEAFSSPLTILEPITSRFYTYSSIDSRPAAERARILLSIWGQAAKAWEAAWQMLRQHPASKHLGNLGPEYPALLHEFEEAAAELARAEPELPMLFPGLPEGLFSELSAALSGTAHFFGSCAGQLKACMEAALTDGSPQDANPRRDGRRIAKPEAQYRALLRDHLGVSLDELLAWEDDEPRKTREEVFRLAASIGDFVPETMTQVVRLLNHCAGPCTSPEEMLAKARGYLKQTRALAHEYVPMPDSEHCDLTGAPWRLRHSFPWGGYMDGDPNERPVHGRMFLNDYNYTAVTDGWIKTNCLHEAYPGHHVQFVRTQIDPIPETMKIGAKSIALMEGMCLRTERAFAFVYGPDPCYALFNAYRRHHAATRIKADLMLYYHGCTIREAARLYEEELGFDPATARGQVQAHEDMPGYFTCYYYGMKKICDWEQEFGLCNKTYTALLFSLSNVSLATFRRVLEMDEAERELFFHGFPSLL